jgi:hypothetical protein
MRFVNVYITQLCIFLFVVFAVMPVRSQISSSTADFTDSLNYPVYDATDQYFVFHSMTPGNPAKGTLVATPPYGTPGFEFSWSKYDPSTNDFDPPFFTESGVDTSRVGNLEPGCYRVHITAADIDTMIRAWVFSNDPYVEVEKDANGKIKLYRITCDWLRLNGKADADTLTYYDLDNGNPVDLPNGMKFEWSADDPEYKISFADRFLDMMIYNNPPYSRPPTSDTRFTLTAVDSFGLSRADNVLYESVHVKAEFSLMIEDEENPGYWIEQENPIGASPLEVKFINASRNGVEFHWKLVDSAKIGENSEFITEDVNDSVVYTYYIPGYYFPIMKAYSEEGCVDSFPLVTRIQIYVEPSELDVANVFTFEQYYPNPTNDLLIIETSRSEQHTIEIHSLKGQLIYSTKIDGPTLRIDLSSFEKGLYFMTVRSRDYVRTEKIIKQ